MSATNFSTVFDAIVSHIQSTGLFETVAQYEFKSAPAGVLSCCVYAPGPSAAIEPVAARSGLATTAKRLLLVARIHMRMLQEPLDDIEPTCLAAAETLFDAFSGDFSLGDTVANIDVFGAYGIRLDVTPGYVTLDQTLFRVFTIRIPIILTDEAVQSG